MRVPPRRAALALLLSLHAACSSPRDSHSSATRSTAGASAATPAALAQALAVPAESLLAAGRQRYEHGDFDSAQLIWQAERRRAAQLKDSAGLARTGMWLGLVARQIGDYATARREGEASLTLKRRLGLDAELSRSFNGLGLLAWNEGRLRDALELYDSASVSAVRNADRAGALRAAANVPLVLMELGDYDGARSGFIAARDTARVLDNTVIEANAIANLAALDIRLGAADRAVPALADARRLYAKLDFAPGEANALGQLATAWRTLGDLQRAIVLADSAVVIARGAGMAQEVAADLEVLADLQFQAGSPRLALRTLREADSLDAVLGLAEERGINLRRRSAILVDVGEGATALASAREALAVHLRGEDRGEVVYDRIQLASALAAVGDSATARAEADSAASDARRTGSGPALRDAAGMGALLALQGGDARGALARLSAAPDDPYDWAIPDLRAGALLRLHRLDEAQRESERAVTNLERERASLGAGPLRAGYFASRAGPVARLVAVHLARADTAAAFRAAAGVAGRSLAERARSGVAAPSGPGVEGERQLLLIAALEDEREAAARKRGFDSVVAQVDRRLQNARSAYEAYLARQAVVAPAADSTVTLAQVQSRLAPGEAVIVTLAGPDRLDLFVARREGVAERSVPVGDRALAARVRVARELLGSPGQREAALAALGELRELLFGTAADPLGGVTRLLVVAHGPLGAVPFGALWDRRAGRFLIENVTVGYLASAASLVRGGDTDDAPRGRMAVFVPFPDSLPGTAEEARSIHRLIGGSETRRGREATERAARAALAAGRPVHIASHGDHDPENPLFSRVMMARGAAAGAGAGSADDGKLEVHEILRIRTRSPLVFLSGCESGLGASGQDPFDRGSDEASLPQAFLIAGARSVVATLWRVPDQGAARIAAEFYRRLALQPGGAEAGLAAAQRGEIAAGRDLTWAAYVVFGAGARKAAHDGP